MFCAAINPSKLSISNYLPKSADLIPIKPFPKHCLKNTLYQLNNKATSFPKSHLNMNGHLSFDEIFPVLTIP